jgi:hypothetical protein
VAKDGYMASLDSAPLARQNEVLVASLVNDNPLPEDYFPLRLVGSSLTKKEMVGAISKIVLELDGATPAAAAPTEAPKATEAPKPTTAPTSAPSAPAAVAGDVVITGAVEKPLGLKEADLRGMEVVKITAEHPKKGTEDYEGVRLSALLALSKPTANAKKIVFKAADGFSAEAALVDVQGCADCLVAFTNTTGKLKMVMPALPSNLWVKDVTTIELK